MLLKRGIIANGIQYAKAIETGHHDVSQYQIGMQAARGFDCLQPIRDGMDAVLIAQQVSHILAHVGIVVGEQDQFAFAGCLRAGCSGD